MPWGASSSMFERETDHFFSMLALPFLVALFSDLHHRSRDKVTCELFQVAHFTGRNRRERRGIGNRVVVTLFDSHYSPRDADFRFVEIVGLNDVIPTALLEDDPSPFVKGLDEEHFLHRMLTNVTVAHLLDCPCECSLCAICADIDCEREREGFAVL